MPLPPLRGHREARTRLARSALGGQLNQSILLHGPPGIGKERLGLWLAQLLVCERPAEGEPCGQCLPCRLVARLEHPDVHWFFPLPRPDSVAQDRLRDKLEEQRAAELQLRRDNPHHVPAHERAPAHFLASIQTLQQLATARPAMGRRKVFVVGDAELMVPQESSPEAANAFLKLLEEPPADTTLVLTTAQPGALLPTIRSRVLPLRLSPLSDEEVAGYLREEMGLAADEAERIAGGARGAIGRALRLAPEAEGAGSLAKLRERAREWLLAALSGSRVPRISAALAQSPTGGRGEFSGQLEALAEWLRDLLAVASGAPESVGDPEARALLERAVQQHAVHPLGVTEALEQVAGAHFLAQGNVNPQLILSNLLRGLQRALRGGAEDRRAVR